MILAVTRRSLLDIHHDVAWFDVPVNELLFVDRSQTGSDLGRDFQRHLYLQPPGAFDQFLQRFPLDKLHRVEITLPVLPRWKTEATFG